MIVLGQVIEIQSIVVNLMAWQLPAKRRVDYVPEKYIFPTRLTSKFVDFFQRSNYGNYWYLLEVDCRLINIINQYFA